MIVYLVILVFVGVMIPAIPVVDYCRVSSFFLINFDCVFGYFGFCWRY
nr:MAG TPA: hypothetical protein [Caudoviricetes sp.]